MSREVLEVYVGKPLYNYSLYYKMCRGVTNSIKMCTDFLKILSHDFNVLLAKFGVYLLHYILINSTTL